MFQMFGVLLLYRRTPCFREEKVLLKVFVQTFFLLLQSYVFESGSFYMFRDDFPDEFSPGRKTNSSSSWDLRARAAALLSGLEDMSVFPVDQRLSEAIMFWPWGLRPEGWPHHVLQRLISRHALKSGDRTESGHNCNKRYTQVFIIHTTASLKTYKW